MTKARKQLKEQTALSSLLLTFTLVCTLVLAGCGGGGGGGGGAAVMPPPDPMPGGGTGGGSTPPQQPMRAGSLLKEVNENPQLANGAAIRILRAAGSRASGWLNEGVASTTQSSYSFDGRTLDSFTYVPEFIENGELHFTYTRLNTRSGQTFSTSTTNPNVSVNRLDGVPAAGWKGVEVHGESSNGIFNWDAYSDIENTGDADYLSLGTWLYIFKDSNTGEFSGSFTLGGAASGNDPFNNDGLAVLTGTAAYEGPAIGTHMMKANADATPVYDNFTAKVSLEANFGDSTEMGTVSGRATEGRTDGGVALPDLTLESANIMQASGTGQGGNFRGGTSANGYSGRWGGKLFGNGASAADQPASIAGTFGGKTDDELRSFIGAFGAYKQ